MLMYNLIPEKDKKEENNKMSNISINNAIPENALERQLYFIEKCKELLHS